MKAKIEPMKRQKSKNVLSEQQEKQQSRKQERKEAKLLKKSRQASKEHKYRESNI